MSDLRPYALALSFAFLPATSVLLQGGPAQADSGSVTMDVLGTLSASLDGEADEWLTIAGTLDGEAGASASWEHISFDMPSGSDMQSQFMAMAGDQVSEEERRQIEQLGALFGGENPMADMFSQMMGASGPGGGGMVRISIAGHHPASPNILSEQVLALDVTLQGSTDPAALTGQAHPADIQYVVENSSGFVPDVFYVSGEEGQATVTFERLELEAGGGHAVGRFEGSLCRMEGARLMAGPDPSDCIHAEGRFDTALIEE